MNYENTLHYIAHMCSPRIQGREFLPPSFVGHCVPPCHSSGLSLLNLAPPVNSVVQMLGPELKVMLFRRPRCPHTQRRRSSIETMVTVESSQQKVTQTNLWVSLLTFWRCCLQVRSEGEFSSKTQMAFGNIFKNASNFIHKQGSYCLLLSCRN